jgi:hypothetical protein
MIKTELEWHSNKEIPDPSKYCGKYLILPLDSDFECVGAWFVDGKFKHFYDWDGNFFTLGDIVCWVVLESATDLVEAFADDIVVSNDLDNTKNEQLEYDNIFDAITEDRVEAIKMKLESDTRISNRLISEMEEPEEDSSFIVANIAKCLECGDTIESHSNWDCKYCSCGNIMIDGGLTPWPHNSACRDQSKKVNLNVYSTDSFETIRTHFKRGSRGVNGDEPLMWVPLKDMTNDHLKATIEYERKSNPSSKFIYLYEEELYYRGEWIKY